MTTTTRQEVCRYAAARLRGLLADASPVPWRTSGPSSRYGGIIAEARPQTPADEVEGYGGELIAESVLAGNGNLLLALSAAAVPVLAILDAASAVPDHAVSDAELVLARAVLDAGEVGWTRNRRPTTEETAAAIRAAAAAAEDVVDAEIIDEDDDADDPGPDYRTCRECEHPQHALDECFCGCFVR